MSAALLTATVLSLAGLIATIVTGSTIGASGDLARHVTFGIFVTLLTLLSHSMLIFYLIGKGRAVRDAVAEGGLRGTWTADIARLRRPVFSTGTMAMAFTMIAALLGAGADTAVLPPFVHGVFGYGSVVANMAALRAEILALTASARIVSEVDRLLKA